MEEWSFLFEIRVLLVSLLLLIVISGWMTIKSTISARLKYLIIPILFVLLYTIFDKSSDMLGHAYPGIPEGRFMLLGYQKNYHYIEIWVKHIDTQKTRLYRLSTLSKEQQKQLKDGYGKTQKGNIIFLRFSENETGMSIISRKLTDLPVMSKDPIPEATP